MAEEEAAFVSKEVKSERAREAEVQRAAESRCTKGDNLDAASVALGQTRSTGWANVRWEKIEAVRRRLNSGTYEVPLRVVAGSMLQDPAFLAEVYAGWRLQEAEHLC